MEPSRGECQALRARPEREVCHNPQIHLLHMPQHLSRLEARKTDNDNAKQQKRKIEDNSNCSQPLPCAQASHPSTLCSNRRGKGRLSAHPDGTIAVLDQTSAIFSLHNRAAGRGPYISYGRNLQTCLNRPESDSSQPVDTHQAAGSYSSDSDVQPVVLPSLQGTTVVFLYDGGNILQTTVANFDGVAVEYLVEGEPLWEVLSYKLKKPVSNAC